MSQIVIDDEFGPIGPGGARALMTSVMGTGPGMKGGPYKLLKSIRIWRSYIGDEGAAAIAEVLRLGGAEVQLNYLELFDDGIGPKGALALGQSLAAGKNVTPAQPTPLSPLDAASGQNATAAEPTPVPSLDAATASTRQRTLTRPRGG